VRFKLMEIVGTKVIVKAKWHEDLRRLTISTATDYHSMRTLLCKLFQLDIQTIKYFDDENDAVRITSDEELEEAIRLSLKAGQILRVEVEGVPAAVSILFPLSTKSEQETPASIVQINSDNGEEMFIVNDANGNTRVSLLKEQVTLGVAPVSDAPNSKSVLTLSQTMTVPQSPKPTTLVQVSKDGIMGISQICERTTADILQWSKDTMNRTNSIASDAATLGNEEIIRMCSSTMELSKASAARVSELSKEIAEATNKAAVGASLLGDELRKATMESMSELSDQARDKTNELSKATSERLDEVLRAFKLQMANAQ